MAETVHLYLKANGVEIKGDSTQVSLGRADSIECLYYEQGVVTPRDVGSGMATGRRQYSPLLIRKQIDRSSPLLAKALTRNETVDGVFKFFRPNPAGTGTTDQFYTVHIGQGRVASIKQYTPDTLAPLEEVTFIFHTISWTFTDGGVTHEDAWS